MRYLRPLLFCLITSFLTSCVNDPSFSKMEDDPQATTLPQIDYAYNPEEYALRMPQHVYVAGHKTIIVDPRVHAWGAYSKQGNLIRGGIATAGAPRCEDSDKTCHTGTGVFHIYAMSDEKCFSRTYPKPKGGGLMPYCMYFNGGQALHGSPDEAVVEDNVSHGCIRMRISDAEWMRYNFATIGTKVVVNPY